MQDRFHKLAKIQKGSKHGILDTEFRKNILSFIFKAIFPVAR